MVGCRVGKKAEWAMSRSLMLSAACVCGAVWCLVGLPALLPCVDAREWVARLPRWRHSASTDELSMLRGPR